MLASFSLTIFFYLADLFEIYKDKKVKEGTFSIAELEGLNVHFPKEVF